MKLLHQFDKLMAVPLPHEEETRIVLDALQEEQIATRIIDQKGRKKGDLGITRTTRK
jgi:hypothetical protein